LELNLAVNLTAKRSLWQAQLTVVANLNPAAEKPRSKLAKEYS